jgi:hypothetical protein
MKIQRVHDIEEAMKCVPFEQEIRNKGRDNIRISKMLLFIKEQFVNPLFGFWIAYDDKEEVLGYTIAMISLIPSMERLLVMRMYAKQNDVRDEFIKTLKNWAKEYKVKIAQMTATKHIKVLERRYKFKAVSVNLERRI